jgi:BASS family bile acid:Na+ symporter
MSAVSLICCAFQFAAGRYVGAQYKPRRPDVNPEVELRGRAVRKVTAGQSLGQKNTVLAIWMATAYLHPMATIAPGSYVLWQNLINSYQLWKKRKKSPL